MKAIDYRIKGSGDVVRCQEIEKPMLRTAFRVRWQINP
jgi:hypothetical protein